MLTRITRVTPSPESMTVPGRSAWEDSDPLIWVDKDQDVLYPDERPFILKVSNIVYALGFLAKSSLVKMNLTIKGKIRICVFLVRTSGKS